MCSYSIFRWLKFRYYSQGFQRTNSIFNLLLPFRGHCALLFWKRYALSFFYHYALAEFGVVHKGVPKLQGSNLVFLWPIGGTIFLKLHGKIIAVPPPDEFS